ncbi:MAG: 2'-5' RNA ligase family protein [Candidatus Hermodarchaeota archaeon]
MSKVYTSAVVIIPPEEKWATIQEIRERYDRQINRWMPHITLLYPFRPENEYTLLEKEFSNKCHHIKPFEIHLKQFKFFNHGKQRFTLWLNPEPIDLIKNLQLKILEIVPDCNDVNKYKNGFKPHLSLGQIKGKSKLDNVINKLQKTWKDINFLSGKIYFISREHHEKDRFEVIKSICLRN